MQEDFINQTPHTLDVLGLSCPKPLLHTKKKLSTMQSGEVLKVLLDSSTSVEDIGFFCQATGHVCIQQTQHEAANTPHSLIYTMWIQKNKT